MLQSEHQPPVFVAVNATDSRNRAIIYYAQIIICLQAQYLNMPLQMVYIRWLHTACAVAVEEERLPSEAELRGPFASFRWDVYPKGRAVGQLREGGPWYGVVHPSQIMYRVHMVRSMHDKDLFRLNTDVYLENL